MACDTEEMFNNAISEYLKKNLTVCVTLSENIDYYSKGVHVSVELLLDGEAISESSDYITTSSSY